MTLKSLLNGTTYTSNFSHIFSKDSLQICANTNPEELKAHVVQRVDKVKKHFLDEEGRLEKLQIKLTIVNLLRRISKMMKLLNNVFEFDIKLVGSANENTRAFFPDEFDFLIIFKILENHADIALDTEDMTLCRVKLREPRKMLAVVPQIMLQQQKEFLLFFTYFFYNFTKVIG